MENKKTPSPTYKKLVKIFSSRIARGIIVLVMLAISVLGMFMLDNRNYIRQERLTFLESNIVESFMAFFKISRFDIMHGAWMLFFLVAGVVLLFTVGNMLEKVFLSDKTDSKKSKAIYYLVILLISAALAFIAYMLKLQIMRQFNYITKRNCCNR